MEPDFSGWATRAGLKCTDGRTIMEDAFKGQDQMKVPLVWQHGHKDAENVLGHAILENRKGGVWCNAYFNGTPKAQHAKEMVKHQDVTMMSIWANDLIERSKRVLHGAIREVSLVISGANPGALIDPVTIRHSDDGDEIVLDDEAIITTGLSFEHTNTGGEMTTIDEKKSVVQVYESLDEDQKMLMHTLLGDASDGEDLEHAADATLQDIYNSLDSDQKDLLHFMVGEAMKGGNSMAQSGIEDDDAETDDDTKEGKEVKHNVFESDSGEAVGGAKSPLSDEARTEILDSAKRYGSLKHAVEQYGLQHGINDIDILFPDAVAVNTTPEFIQRRMEWVGVFMAGTSKSPFSRLKSFSADITMDEARAKGYIKGSFKKEEFFGVTRRETTPTTVYKKQKLDRDDIVDITTFDIVSWLKSEMRLMLDEEIARAALMGDGRGVDDEDKISETNIRPIATEHELYATTININMLDASSSIQEFIDAVITNRKLYKGSGTPTLFTSETVIAQFLLLKDTLGRGLYSTIEEVANVLRVRQVVPVELMDEDDTLVGIIVNPVDYTFGSTAGGEVSLFDDFDIDYNQYKYLIETRVSGCLTRLKSALVFRKRESGSDVLITPSAPTFDEDTGELTIVNTAHVVYKRTDTDAVVTAGASPYTIDSGESITIEATADSGYYFANSDVDNWTFTAN